MSSQQQFPPHELDKYYLKTAGGYFVVVDAAKMSEVKELLISRGIDPKFIICQDVSMLFQMSQEQKLDFFASAIEENIRFVKRLQQKEVQEGHFIVFEKN